MQSAWMPIWNWVMAVSRARLLLISILWSWAAATAAQTALPDELQAAWRATGLPQSALSLAVQEADGKALFSLNDSQPRNPASVMKIVTTWAGLHTLGPEYRWRTAFLAEGGGRTDAQGTLSGPLYVKAGGDPLLTVADLWNMLRELRMRGVKNLTSVVVDRSVFGSVSIDPAAFDASGDRPYNASPDAMMVGLGAFRVFVYPDPANKVWVPVVDPSVPGVRVSGRPQWRDGTCQGSPGGVGVNVQQQENGVVINVSGEATGSCGAFSVWRLALSQPEYFSAVFRMLWRELGGTLARNIAEGAVPATAIELVWHQSDSLANIIRRINKLSNNVMARHLLLGIAAKTHGPRATPEAGARAILGLLGQNGIDTSGWSIENGSGLSRTSRLTARGLAGMLAHAWRSPIMPEFMSSMAISGVDGTVRRRLRNGSAHGRAHLKTGTLRDARALAGYVQGESGKRYILVSMVNHDNAVAARPFEDALVQWLSTR